jgi:hypothetical protein
VPVSATFDPDLRAEFLSMEIMMIHLELPFDFLMKTNPCCLPSDQPFIKKYCDLLLVPFLF